MIGLLIQDNVYEQDIRELLMSFYPGETYAHEVKDGVDFYVETRLGTGEVGVYIWEPGASEDGAVSVEAEALGSLRSSTKTAPKQPQVCPPGLTGFSLTAWGGRPADLTDHSGAKNVVKKLLYEMLTARTGRTLPWGSLTGIRPVKIALARLEEGWTEDEIRRFMKDTYLASRRKIDLCVEIAAREKRLLRPLDYQRGYSLYIGIPFCPTTCMYCSFTSYPISKWMGRTGLYLEALFKELEYTARKMEGRPLDTVYLGGGTPTALPTEDIDLILCKLEGLFNMQNAMEFTVEAGRPDSISEEKLKTLRAHGVSRISINPQTMNQKTLDFIGRKHTVEMVREKFHMARELGFDNINMDLIMGLPGEGLEDVEHTLEEVKALRPDSLTVHSLAIKRAARLKLFKEEHGELQIQNPPEMIDLSEACARELGMEPYYLYRQKNMAGNFENVGYSLPGKACIYNILIMEEQQTIIGCGPGVTTKVVYPAENRRERCENVKEVEQYISRIGEMLERKEKILY
ncbi:MAG: coproporphyrinogen dehydrogenase HemZ [Clostridiaceae bacterium]|uniref:Coproporphyrinogen dehydrogenase HemZ n=1 Tax=Clostridium porci TaxID=2605778 RepID=A0A7X2NLQ2_9CLOT|nr:coproporphyrinogen dehydrogenase HemZ [Clostridium porci]MDY3232370.1 coproporphyrinogen dehydrogenase HemZ [Clostridiaceae bacterium]MSS37189.1 coproporphyrinogen dehydrogenase HemZ [Clostridium porci]